MGPVENRGPDELAAPLAPAGMAPTYRQVRPRLGGVTQRSRGFPSSLIALPGPWLLLILAFLPGSPSGPDSEPTLPQFPLSGIWGVLGSFRMGTGQSLSREAFPELSWCSSHQGLRFEPGMGHCLGRVSLSFSIHITLESAALHPVTHTVCLLFKNPWIHGPVLFKPMLFKSQLDILGAL